MKEAELRAGNYIQFWDYGDDKWLPTQVIGGAEIGWIEKGDAKVQGTPLTEEWFKKFGYKPEYYGGQGNEGWSVFVKGLGRLFSHDGLIWHPSMALGNFLKVELKHVHTFQNLYFALTGKELVIQKDA